MSSCRRSWPRIRASGFKLTEDMRELLLQDLMEHLDAIGRPDGQIVLVDPKYETDGPDEPEALAAYYRQRHGLSVLHADASELRLRGDEVMYGDTRVDLVYRDASVLDLDGSRGRRRGRRANARAASTEPRRLVDHRGAGSEELLRGVHRFRARRAVPDGGGTTGDAPTRVVDAHRLRSPDRVARRRADRAARVCAEGAGVACSQAEPIVRRRGRARGSNRVTG